MITLNEALQGVVYPLLELLGFLLRPIGALGVGMVAGIVLRHAMVFKQHMRFFGPLIFFGVAALILVPAFSPGWSGAGTLGMLGVGLFIGYMFLMRGQKPAEVEEKEEEKKP
jgi:hypothetical protein